MGMVKRFRMLPWLLLFEAARVLRSHLTEHLSPQDRSRVVEIVRRTKGDPRRVTKQERSDLRRIAVKLDLVELARDMVPVAGRAMRGGKRRR
jgi:hypothetical protein